MRILSYIITFVLSLRYRVTFQNLEIFDTSSPQVVFPNHPALVDPMLLLSHIGKKKLLSPVMTETYFHTPGLSMIVRALQTVPVGDIARGGSIEDVKKAFDGIREALKKRQNILIYPSGHIYVQPFEHIVGKKMAYEMISLLDPETRIIGVRTKWLWGSIWGKAYTGTSPELMKVLLTSIWYLIANLFFFVPKRDVSIEFIDLTDDLKKWHQDGLDGFNQKLQDFYNEWGNEPCRFLPHYFYYDDVKGKVEPKKITGSVAEVQAQSGFSRDLVDDATWEKVRSFIAETKKSNPDTIMFETNLILDLHADSLDMAEMKSRIQSAFSTATNPPIGSIKTAGDLAAVALGLLREEADLPVCSFLPRSEHRVQLPDFGEGMTLLTLLRENFRHTRERPFLYDAMTWSMTRDAFLLRSYVIATVLRKYRDEKIGIMLPALSATSLLLTGAYLAGKLPVMLNWTVGEKSFAHCMEFAKLEHILTSRRFYEKISTPWLAPYESKMIFIEDIIKDISLTTKLTALVRKALFLIPDLPPEAVMLFTSGSESLPKAVVLTHKNLIADITGALHLVPFHQDEVLLGILPPFHSFWFTLNTIFPLIAPIQAAYTPDPGDARTIGKIMSHTSATILSATPTFLRMILSGNERHMLESLRFAFVGAEKCSDEVFHLFESACPHGVILEGYGITECSPIVSVNPLDRQKRGTVGKFLPSLEYEIRSLDGKTTLPLKEQGMIFVSGPSIFWGYLDMSLESPFEERSGKKWYKTGDLGFVDEEGYLSITGRLKRFVKIAGEMISLPFIESILLEKYGNPESVQLAIEAKEELGTTTIVAFTTFEVGADELNDYIHQHGAANIVRIHRVERIEAIPLLGTGKTDYKQLKSLI